MKKEKTKYNTEVCSILIKTYCSNHCIFCRPLGEDSRRTPEQVVQIEKEICSDIKKFREIGYESIEVSGGDPVDYDKLPELIATIRKKGFKWVRVSTHGVRLANKNFLNKLLKNRIDVFRIPLYGATAGVHDSVTRIKGSFDKTVLGIKNIKEKSKDSKLLLISLVLKQNIKELTQIFDLMHDLGCSDLYFSPAFISNGDYSYYLPYRVQAYLFRKLVRHASRRGLFLRLRDVPFCVLGFDNDFTENTMQPARLGEKERIPESQRTSFSDVPSYRLKMHEEICKQCDVVHKCAGFLVNDVTRYGVKGLKPIKKKAEKVVNS